MGKKYVIGIDLGGTKISGALSDVDGNVLSQYTLPTNAFEGETAVLERVIKVVDKVLNDGNKTSEDIKAIGIGSPGPLDAKNGIIITTPNLPFKNFKLVDPIKDKFGVPTYLDNDGNVAAVGEFVFGAGQGTKNMVFVTVSTGIGGGAVLNGQVYRGNTSNALEIGHMTLEKDGPRCNCGNYGCAEALASGTAIGKRGKEAVLGGEPTSLKNYDDVTSYEVFLEAKKGDKVASEILDKSLNYLGICVANLIVTFDPEMVVIGGGVSKGGNIVFEKVKEVVNTRCFKAMAESCKIVPAGLGTDAGVMGAVALAVIESK
ncbi:ROK family protein [Clostridium pasteurianum]|uniref:Transcriptional regulator/sugar kinase n=1 Tax=Clostridium pasteurianum BC1 TaxID=86416 RepID=R4KAE4_CLOPA|nr:ROK family protein [Clostridium pasteurianum]AGK98676.1 transcriptional regulator/sugar kinase [Clostridium pasteurianum BC1]